MKTLKTIRSHKTFYFKLLGFFIKNGKKAKAKRLINSGLLKVHLEMNDVPVIKIFDLVFSKLDSLLEVKAIRVRRSTHLVPIPISRKRRLFLTTNWLRLAIEKNAQKVSSVEKLFNEIRFILNDDVSSYALLAKQQNDINAVSCRSNGHYRW